MSASFPSTSTSSSSSTLLLKRPSPPTTQMTTPTTPTTPTIATTMGPPAKRIKRPPKVLTEDDYTTALSQIIARDFFPGLLQTQTQREYLNALDSKNEAWITESGRRLREVNGLMTMTPGRRVRRMRDTAAAVAADAGVGDSPVARGRVRGSPSIATTTPGRRAAGVTPRGFRGDDTPGSMGGGGTATSTVMGTEDGGFKSEMDAAATTLSLSAFQSKYTSEDNESFNALLDKQNAKRRDKHLYLWATDQRIPSPRQIAYRNREARLLKQRADDHDTAGKDSMVVVAPPSITVGAGEDRPAQPDSWRIKKPDNALMFPPGSVNEDGLETVAETRQNTSRAGPKGVVYENTRLPPPLPLPQSPHGSGPAPSSPPSLSAVRDAIAGRPRFSASEVAISDADGGETPRVKGYAFVDEDEPENSLTSADAGSGMDSEPTYRDLLAGQAGDGTPNPFKIGEMRKREDLHHRLVERDASRKRDAVRSGVSRSILRGSNGTTTTPRFPSSPVIRFGGRVGLGNTTPGGDGGILTPAAKRLFDRLGKTPVASPLAGQEECQGAGVAASHTAKHGMNKSRNMWTPTPKRNVNSTKV